MICIFSAAHCSGSNFLGKFSQLSQRLIGFHIFDVIILGKNQICIFVSYCYALVVNHISIACLLIADVAYNFA
ncbi:hypothetical protein DSECCO2_594740 [anaerobic digester metagenome]